MIDSTRRGSRLPLRRKILFTTVALAIIAGPVWFVMEIFYRVWLDIPITGGVLYEDDLKVSQQELESRPQFKHFLKNFKLSDNPILFYEPRPGFSGSFVDAPSVKLSINSHGFRDYEYPVEKDADCFRIVVLGDSIVWGNRMPLEQTFPKRLEQMLTAASSQRFEVLNFGVSGYSTRQEVELFRVRASRFGPDLVIVGYCLNDYDANSSVESEAFKHLYYDIFSKSYLYDCLQRVFTSVVYRRTGYSIRDPQAQFNLRRQFELLQQYCPNRKCVVVIFPGLHDFDNYYWEDEHFRVWDALEGLNCEVLDLFDHFSRYRADQLMIDPTDNTHPNSLGHKIAAEAVMDFLQTGELIPIPVADTSE